MAPHKLKPLILVVDDEPAILQAIKDALTDENFRTHTVGEGKNVLSIIGELVPDLVLLDIFMPNCNGLDLLKQIKEQYPEQQVIIMSGFGTIPIAVNALNLGAKDFIEKPLSLDDLLEKVNEFDQPQPDSAISSDQKQSYESAGIIGKSTMFCELMRQVELIAPLSYNALIYGDQGTGKSLIAHYIHKKSPLATKQFFTIETTSILKLSQLSKQAEATVYIKNIHLFSRDKQEAIYSFIKEHPQMRFIASASPKLFTFVQQQIFNSSLFYLLNIVPIEIVSLAKRRHDIPLLTSNFLKHENKEQNKNVSASPEAIRCLRNYSWLGNVKELESTIKKLVALSNKEQVISREFLLQYMQAQVPLFCEEQSFNDFDSLDKASQMFEHQFLSHLYKKNGYKIDALSEQLKIDPDILKAKINI